jgi:hypothetical protein
MSAQIVAQARFERQFTWGLDPPESLYEMVSFLYKFGFLNALLPQAGPRRFKGR